MSLLLIIITFLLFTFTNTRRPNNNHMAFAFDIIGSRQRRSCCNKLALLDRDGVINVDVGSPGVTNKDQLILTSKAAYAIGQLRRNGYYVVMITNQSCVGKGLVTENYLNNEIHGKLQYMLKNDDDDAIIDGIYVCTSIKSDNDPRMKPSPGMIQEALHDYNIKNPEDCFFVGDTITDLQAATSGGIPLRILVSTGYGLSIMNNNKPERDETFLVDNNTQEQPQTMLSKNVPPSVLPFVYVNNLYSAVQYVLKKE